MTDRDSVTRLETDLREAEAALEASIRALDTHGFQAITWGLYRSDAKRVEVLRRRLSMVTVD